jgi:hypothetical protein
VSGAEFALNTTQAVTNFIAGRLAASGWSAVVARLKAGRGTESLGGSTEDRQEAYAQLRRSVIEFRTALAVLAATTPRRAGALWMVPLHLRLIRRIPDLSSELLDRLLAVHTVGRLAAIEAADSLLTSLASAVDVYSETSGDRRARLEGKMDVALVKVDGALADFTMAVRRDLGFGDVRTHAPFPERELSQD